MPHLCLTGSTTTMHKLHNDDRVHKLIDEKRK
jgi:hypothetical protein